MSAPTTPRGRAFWPQIVLRRREQLTPAQRAAGGEIPAAVIARVRGALPFDWIPARDAILLADANARAQGERFRDTSNAHLQRELMRAPIRTFLKGLARAAAGDELRGAMSILRYCYATMLRDCGTITVESVSSASFRVVHDDAPDFFVESPSYRPATFIRSALWVVGLTSSDPAFELEGGRLVSTLRDIRPMTERDVDAAPGR